MHLGARKCSACLGVGARRRGIAVDDSLPECLFFLDQHRGYLRIEIDVVDAEVASSDQHGHIAHLGAGHGHVVLNLREVVLGDFIGAFFSPVRSGSCGFDLEHTAVRKQAVHVGNHERILGVAEGFGRDGDGNTGHVCVLLADDGFQAIAPFDGSVRFLDWILGNLVVVNIERSLPFGESEDCGDVAAADACLSCLEPFKAFC